MSRKLLQQIIRVTLVTLFLVGCGAPAPTPTPTPVPPTATPVPPTATPDPSLSPEIYLQSLAGANTTTAVTRDGSITASTMTVSRSGVIVITIVHVANHALAEPAPSADGTSVEVPTIGDGSIAYTTPPMGIGGTNSVLAFIKGNVEVMIRANPLMGGEVSMHSIVELAEAIEESLPDELPIQPITVGSTSLESTAFNEYFESITLGKRVPGSGDSEDTLTPATIFTTTDDEYCLAMTFNKEPRLVIAIYDEQKQVYVIKTTGGLSVKEAETMDTIRCLGEYYNIEEEEFDQLSLERGKYKFHVWVDGKLVAEYPFEIQ